MNEKTSGIGERIGHHAAVPSYAKSLDGPVWFNAVLTPHRSLSPVGFTILMSVLAMISFTAGMFFVMHGAWPVFGFFGLDVGLVYFAFKLNYRSGRIAEKILLDQDSLTVARHYPGGQVKSWKFEPYWVQVLMLAPRGRDPVLTLRSHGKDLVIAAFLTVPERQEVADALLEALRRRAMDVEPS
ncbi:MAG TPA: DUF2244 domain-containing protein [Alphaproteobacteria bacterium]|nr:DUF2244 domain-containing protein [Alphaproteobacteria bacterium]